MLDEILQAAVVYSLNRRNPRRARRKSSSFLPRPRNVKPVLPIDSRDAIEIVEQCLAEQDAQDARSLLRSRQGRHTIRRVLLGSCGILTPTKG